MTTNWKNVHAALSGIAKRRAALDAEEAKWLREAEHLELWRELGCVSMLDYMERTLGYEPRTAQERLRVARLLGTLPQLEAALADGEFPFSTIRELTRKVTPATEGAWLRYARGKTVREVQAHLADREPGDLPDDPGKPRIRMRTISFEVTPETYARLRQARVKLESELGRRVTDDEFQASLAESALEAGTAARATTGRAKYQIAYTICEVCRQGWQHGGGRLIAVERSVVERATCDARSIGTVDVPARATQDVPPRIVRLVWHRDAGRCRVPGCRSARNLEIHHLVPREQGGTHDPSNLMLCCDACHAAHHRGVLHISGTAPDGIVVARPRELPWLGERALRSAACDALIARGWQPARARSAIEAACAHVGAGTSLDAVIREALRRGQE